MQAEINGLMWKKTKKNGKSSVYIIFLNEYILIYIEIYDVGMKENGYNNGSVLKGQDGLLC